ncbi:MAG: hypothetical protein EHM19_04830 [Candidatus Latescibacterota bacterium]|nr:MAG: hypothetical protein EHM19_04830 [Candidatus Latescibacterota bacterium]
MTDLDTPSGFDRVGETAGLVRRLLASPDAAAREALAAAASRYLRGYLSSLWGAWAWRFGGEFADAVEGAADLVVGRLLIVRREASPRFPHLERGIRGMLRAADARRGAAGRRASLDPASWAEAAPDDEIFFLFTGLLRRQGMQALLREWKERNHEEARLWDRLRANAVKSGALFLRRDSRDYFLTGPNPDFSRPPLPMVDLAETFSGGCRDEQELLRRLAERLAPDSSRAHGRYVRFAWVARAWADLSAAKIVHPDGETGALPASLGTRVTRGGVPLSLFRERVFDEVRSMAARYLAADERKGLSPPLDGHLAPLAEIAAEMVCRAFGMGKECWDGLAQRSLYFRLLPFSGEEEYDRTYRSRLDYAVRRIRGWLAAAHGEGKSGAGAR